MTKLIRIIVVAGLLLFTLVLTTGSASSATATATATDTQPISSTTIKSVTEDTPAVIKNSDGDSEVTGDGNLLLQYAPQGGIVTIVLGGILMIIKNYNEGKRLDIESYKKRYEDLRISTDSELNKAQNKVDLLTAQIAVLADGQDVLRKALETRKSHYTEERLANEAVHREQIEQMNDILVAEIRLRHLLERLLAENGVDVPKDPA